MYNDIHECLFVYVLFTDVNVSMTVSSNVTSEAEGGISVLVSVDAGDVRSNIILGLSTIPISARSKNNILGAPSEPFGKQNW